MIELDWGKNVITLLKKIGIAARGNALLMIGYFYAT
jgi:hypothetical protein